MEKIRKNDRILNAKKETQPDDEEKPEEETVRGIIVMPNVPGTKAQIPNY